MVSFVSFEKLTTKLTTRLGEFTDGTDIEKYQQFVREAAALVVKHGGSISGEDGDGQSKADLLPIMFGEDFTQAYREFKEIFDPGNRMNPGKVVNAYHNDENLRLGLHYNPWQPDTHFHYGEDDNDFPETMLRCVGVGQYRRREGGTRQILRENFCTSGRIWWPPTAQWEDSAPNIGMLMNGKPL